MIKTIEALGRHLKLPREQFSVVELLTSPWGSRRSIPYRRRVKYGGISSLPRIQLVAFYAYKQACQSFWSFSKKVHWDHRCLWAFLEMKGKGGRQNKLKAISDITTSIFAYLETWCRGSKRVLVELVLGPGIAMLALS